MNRGALGACLHGGDTCSADLRGGGLVTSVPETDPTPTGLPALPVGLASSTAPNAPRPPHLPHAANFTTVGTVGPQVALLSVPQRAMG